MKVFELTKSTGIDALTMTDRPTPKPGHGQVLVRMRAH
jgi:NADPH:quinone reductase-like Zn-dependent oxidoreductase